MIVTYEHCSARYKLDPSRITGRGVRITCPSCKHVFVVYRPGGDEAASPASAASPAAAPGPVTPAAPPSPPPTVSASFGSSPSPVASAAPVAGGAFGGRSAAAVQPAAPKLDLDTLDFSSVGIQAWKVKVRIGLVYDFSDYKTLARYIKDGRVGQDDQISHDGKTWTRLGDIADLQQHFLDVYIAARDRRETEASGSNFEEDDPTRIVGVESVSRSLGELGRSPPTAELEAAARAAADAPEEAAGPRFDDPFEKARARREKSTRPVTTSSRTVPVTPPAASGPASRGPSVAVVVLVGLVLGGLGAGGWFLWQERQTPTIGETPAQQQLREAALRAEAEKAKADMREQYKEDLAGALEPTEIKPMFEENPEDVRIPVGPGQRGGTRPATTASGGTTASAKTSASTGVEAGMSVGATTPADHYSAGRSAFNAGNYPLAVQGFRQAVSGAPTNAEYRYYLGLALDRTGSGEAVRELVEAGRLGSRSAYKLLGDILGRQGDVSGAVGYYQQYLATNPSDAAAVQAEIDRLTH